MNRSRLQRAKDRKLIRTPLRLAWKFRRALFIFFLVSFNAWGVNSLAVHAEGPQSDATHPSVAPIVHPVTEHDQIVAYIKQVFGDQATNAFKILACENHSLNPNASGHNDNGTFDTGIFQVNSIWANPVLLTNWKTNIDIAHQIYLRGGWNEWACEYVYHALERKDTI